ncbi:MAG: glycoside hydrolase family 73 protein [Saprospiraceae bacterium]
MRLLHTLWMSCFLPLLAAATVITESERQYFIETYSLTAVNTMQYKGIPASITLGQAILESNWGQGEAAVNANNFFCIKCNNGWEGPTFYAWDDEKEKSCFRSYGDISESFSDHSDFLSNNVRYARLFQYDITDYTSWASGLEECGYATDTEYAEKLIGLIETYGLFIYDYAVPAASFQLLTSPVEAEEGGYTSNDALSSGSAPGVTQYLTLESPPVGGQVMTAPAYRVEKARPQKSQFAAISQGFAVEVEEAQIPERDKPVRQGRKIRPIYPLPDVKWE